jgi:Uncharacterized protein conserved in bacteria (DUF2252)
MEAHDKKLGRTLRLAEAKGYRHDPMLALARLTKTVDGERRFISDPALIVPLAELDDREDEAGLESLLRALFRRYRRTLSAERQTLIERFRYADLARKSSASGVSEHAPG